MEEALRPTLYHSSPEKKQRNSGKGLYLYCVFSGREYVLPLEKGINGHHTIFTISYDDIDALVSYVALSDYSGEPLQSHIAEQDIQWIASRVQHHERLLERLMQFCTVIPVKFCTIFHDERSVLTMLERNYECFTSLLVYLKDKQEWGMKVYVDTKKFGERLAETTPFLKEVAQKIAAASQGAAYFLKKKQEAMLNEEIGKQLTALAEAMYEKLQSWAVDSCRNKVLDSIITGKAEKMILNAALLIKTSDVERLKAKAEALASEYSEQGMVLEISGPWPPYNFCSK
jgi:hypothetical protein